MPINPCENCPEGAKYRLDSELKDNAESKLVAARERQAQLRAGRSILRNIWSEFAPTKSEWELSRQLEIARLQTNRYAKRMPGEIEAAIENCTGPYEQLTDVDDGTDDKWQNRICGARVALSDLAVRGCRIEAQDSTDNGAGPEKLTDRTE